MKYLDLDEILERANQMGLKLTERTFRYYGVLGLLPHPVKGAEDARVRYYPETVLETLQTIRELQQEGYSLKQIKRQLEHLEAGPEALSRLRLKASNLELSTPALRKIRSELLQVLERPSREGVHAVREKLAAYRRRLG